VRPRSSRRVEQDLGPEDVRPKEERRVVDAAVHVRLGGEIHDRLGPLLREDPRHFRRVADVRPMEAVPGVPRHVRKVRKVPRVGQLVHVHDGPVGVGPEDVPDEVRADESGPPGHENPHQRAPPSGSINSRYSPTASSHGLGRRR